MAKQGPAGEPAGREIPAERGAVLFIVDRAPRRRHRGVPRWRIFGGMVGETRALARPDNSPRKQELGMRSPRHNLQIILTSKIVLSSFLHHSTQTNENDSHTLRFAAFSLCSFFSLPVFVRIIFTVEYNAESPWRCMTISFSLKLPFPEGHFPNPDEQALTTSLGARCGISKLREK